MNNDEKLIEYIDIKNDDSRCYICKLPFEKNHKVSACPTCRTFFHRDHIFEWLKVKGKCPACSTKSQHNDFINYESFNEMILELQKKTIPLLINKFISLGDENNKSNKNRIKSLEFYFKAINEIMRYPNYKNEYQATFDSLIEKSKMIIDTNIKSEINDIEKEITDREFIDAQIKCENLKSLFGILRDSSIFENNINKIDTLISKIKSKSEKSNNECQIHITNGNKYLSELNFDDARIEFEKALDIRPKLIQVKNKIMELNNKINTQNKILEILSKFQPNIPVSLLRIAELSYESREETESFILKILEKNKEIGNYLEFEQVFIKNASGNSLIEGLQVNSNQQKVITCYYCGSPLSNSDKQCTSCDQKIVTCSVCKLPISFGEDIGECYQCHTLNHLIHLQEWVKTRGKCPHCIEKITFRGNNYYK